MVKALDSTYDAGRRGGAWRKVKPVRTLDLVVLAAEWGHGRRAGLALEPAPRRPRSRRHVRDGGQDVQGPHRRPARVADQRAARRARSVATGSPCTCGPSWWSRSRSTACRRRRRYPGGVALRFARVRRYRDDKTADDADPIEAVQAMLPG